MDIKTSFQTLRPTASKGLTGATTCYPLKENRIESLARLAQMGMKKVLRVLQVLEAVTVLQVLEGDKASEDSQVPKDLGVLRGT